jgi:subtilisin family serine protease
MRVITAIAVVILVTVSFDARPSAQAAAQGNAVAAQILVKFRPGASGAAKADAHRAGGGRVLSEVSRTGVQLVGVAGGDETGAINRYRRNPNVLYAERNIVRHIPKPVSLAKPVNHTPGSELVPGDYYFKEQWALHNTGQQFYCFPWIFGEELCFYVGTPDADIDAPEAWGISTGSTVLVAVIDTGIDYTHPDLMFNYAGGVDFVNGDGDPMDDHGHGTHVSGTIAASLNNVTGDPSAEEGVVGVAPNARIVAYKVCDASGNCSDFAIEQGIAQAISVGAKVINMSLGGPEISQSLTDAVQDAWNAGIVIVAGAGNDGNTNKFYPAALPNVISVGAFDEDHRRASFSNYGSWVEISAPGNVIMSSYPMSQCVESGVPGDAGCYNWLSGTSMATPHVSGAAALVWSRGDVTTNRQVFDIIVNSADPRGVDSVRLDSWTKHGGLNIHNALSYGLTNLSPTASAGPDQTVVDTGGDSIESVTLDGSASSDADGSIVTYEWREGTTFVAFGATPSVFLPVGAHTLTLEVTDDRGATASDSVVITVRANLPPVANAGADQILTDTGGDGAEAVVLNGSGSSDPDGTIVSYVWKKGATVIALGATPPAVSLPVGVHTITLQVTDDRGATASDTVDIAINAPPPPPPPPGPSSVHVGDLDGSSAGNKNMWSAVLTVTVHNTIHQPVAGATVTGAWGGALSGTGACTTGSDGKCIIASGDVRKRDSSASFTVNGVSVSELSYAVGDNHDPDGDSTGRSISIAKP